MCLDVNSKRKIAKKDIKCYTLAEVIEDELVTFYQSTPIIAEMTSKLISKQFNVDDIIVEVGLHSFKYKKDAIDRNAWEWNCPNEIIILSWIIPKGASYYEGYFQSYSTYLSYASNKRNLVNPEILEKWKK